MTEYEIRKQWFLDRIGERVYRNKTTCECEVCAAIYIHGLEIEDEMHANYLFDCECDYTAEGYLLRYFDTREEVAEFELKNK